MRLDKYLKVSRLIKRRTVANQACGSGRVCVNGKVAKASHDLKIGDRVSVAFGSRSLEIIVTSLQESVRRGDASLYDIVSS